MIIHKTLANGRWLELPLIEQLSNVGCDLARAVKWRNKGDIENSKKAFDYALKFFDLTINDSKHIAYRDELLRVHSELINYFMGNNEHNVTDEEWDDYFLFFNYLYALQKGK